MSNPDQKKPEEHFSWGKPDHSSEKRKHRNVDEHPDIFFTLKVYSQVTGREEKGRSLKFTVDFTPPFEPNLHSPEPYYISTRHEENVKLFKEILEHVGEVFRYISDPVKYTPMYKHFDPTADKERRAQQDNLHKILELAEGRINHIFYEQASANLVGVGAVALSDGNGDMRPPKKPGT